MREGKLDPACGAGARRFLDITFGTRATIRHPLQSGAMWLNALDVRGLTYG